VVSLVLQSRGRGLDSRPGRYQVVSTWMGDCGQVNHLGIYLTNNKVNSAFQISRVGKSSTGLPGWG